jgi:hypothetical protein
LLPVFTREDLEDGDEGAVEAVEVVVRRAAVGVALVLLVQVHIAIVVEHDLTCEVLHT